MGCSDVGCQQGISDTVSELLLVLYQSVFRLVHFCVDG